MQQGRSNSGMKPLNRFMISFSGIQEVEIIQSASILLENRTVMGFTLQLMNTFSVLAFPNSSNLAGSIFI